MENTVSIVEHTIRGVGGFSEETKITMSPEKVTLLLGVNGAGKTTILNSIYRSICDTLSFTTVKHKEFGISKATISFGDEKSEVYTLFKLEATLSLYEIGYRLLLNGQINLIGSNRKKIRDYFMSLYRDYNNSILPLFRYFQTEKLDNTNKINRPQYNKMETRNIGYVGHYSKIILIQEVTEFIINQVNIENQAKVDNNNLEYETPMGKYIRGTLNEFTSILYNEHVEVEVKHSRYSSNQTLVVTKSDQKIEFPQLSSGEKYILSLILELIYRAAILNPNMEDLREIPGIVLIDEIEDHLHPKWQLTILQALQACFPNIQFIVSSHSPLIASSVRREQIVALYDFSIIPTEEIPDIYSGTANEVLDKVLHAGFQINTFQDKKREIDILINKFDFETAEEKLNSLKALVNSNPQWIKNLERKIAFAKA